MNMCRVSVSLITGILLSKWDIVFVWRGWPHLHIKVTWKVAYLSIGWTRKFPAWLNSVIQMGVGEIRRFDGLARMNLCIQNLEPRGEFWKNTLCAIRSYKTFSFSCAACFRYHATVIAPRMSKHMYWFHRNYGSNPQTVTTATRIIVNVTPQTDERK